MRWTVLIPARSLPEAKSRLLGAVGGAADLDLHHRLVLAIRSDTLEAARSASGVARVVVVSDRPLPAGRDRVFVQRSPGLNAALAESAADATARWPHDAIAALLGDLPALRPDELAATLAQAACTARGYVPDADGTGTTLLTVHPGVPLAPAFGAGSAARHALTADVLDAGPGLRRDVDTAQDLEQAAAHGLGPATRALLDSLAHSPVPPDL